MTRFKLLFMIFLISILFASSSTYMFRYVPFVDKYAEYSYIPEDFRKTVVDICLEYEIPILLFSNIIKQESQWDPKAIGKNYTQDGKVKSYDSGLTQLNSKYHKYFEDKFNDGNPIDPHDPETAIRVGAKYLKWAYDLTSSWTDAILVYNGGYGNWKKGTTPKSSFKYLKIVSEGVELK